MPRALAQQQPAVTDAGSAVDWLGGRLPSWVHPNTSHYNVPFDVLAEVAHCGYVVGAAKWTSVWFVV